MEARILENALRGARERAFSIAGLHVAVPRGDGNQNSGESGLERRLMSSCYVTRKILLSSHDFHPTSSLPILLLFRVWVVQEIFLGKCGRDEKIVHEQYKDRLTIQGKLDIFSYFRTKI